MWNLHPFEFFCFHGYSLFITSPGRFLWNTKGWLIFGFFFFFNSHKLFVSCQDLNLYNGVLFPFTPTHLNLQFQKGAAGRFIHYMFSTFLENWLLKHWLGFLGSMCDVWLYLCDSDKNTWLKCQRLNNMTQGVLS